MVSDEQDSFYSCSDEQQSEVERSNRGPELSSLRIRLRAAEGALKECAAENKQLESDKRSGLPIP